MKYSSLVLILAAAIALAGCGTQDGATDDAAATSETATPAGGAEETETAAEVKSAIPPRTAYVVAYDPDAFYTEDDLPVQGNLLKLNFTGMSPETVNKVIHRLKTEKTPCEGETCVGLLYEASLVTQSHCDVTLRAAKKVIQEEKMKAGEWRPGQ